MTSAKPGKYASKLIDKKVLVLGGTSGLGFAVAEAAWEFGAKVTISGSRQPKVDHKLSEMKANNPAGDVSKLQGFACDLGNKETLEGNLKSLFDQATDSGTTKLDHIVFSAGDAPPVKPLAEVDVAYLHAAGLVRLVAPCIIGKLCAAHGYLKSSASSSITFTSGMSESKPGAGHSSMLAAFGGIEVFTRGLAVDLAPVRVNCVAPGGVDTELAQAFGGESLLNHFRERSTTKTVGKPEDVAEAYLYSMRDQFVTGTVIETNGGGLLV